VSNATPIEAGSTRLPESVPSCRSCGACCSFAPDWPRFTTEEDSALDRIPGSLVAADLSGMRCNGNRCSALVGEVGISTSCMIYDARPDVCRACVAGDEACGMARSRFGLPALTL
jgi:Fe-S-cluster containining protein